MFPPARRFSRGAAIHSAEIVILVSERFDQLFS
ncbi:MAG: hypothetical protein QOH78_2367, partial [Verrucomicrobiota bacterium]